MKFIFLLFMLPGLNGFAQKRPVVPGMPDLATLQKMSPTQLKALQQKIQAQYSNQIKTQATAANVKINESLLPDFAVWA